MSDLKNDVYDFEDIHLIFEAVMVPRANAAWARHEAEKKVR